MNRTITIPVLVLPQHIQNGQAGNCDTCPIALAISDTINANRRPGTRREVLVYRDRICIPGRWVGITPEIACNFIRKFDDLGRGEPFFFELTMHRIPKRYGGSRHAGVQLSRYEILGKY